MRSLLLIPTKFEKARIEQEALSSFRAMGISLELCGFGVIASAAQAARLITQHEPERVFLVGISGLYRRDDVDNTWIGRAAQFSRVVSYGIGVGSGQKFKSAGSMGWSQLQSETLVYPLDDSIELDTLGGSDTRVPFGLLVSVTAASADNQEATEKLSCFPNALAEDMEGFGVAMACQLCQVPLTIIRGFSNWVGDRDHKNWKVSEAMENACKLLIELSRSQIK